MRYNTNVVCRINCNIPVNLLQPHCNLLLNQLLMDDLFHAESWNNRHRLEHSAKQKQMC